MTRLAGVAIAVCLAAATARADDQSSEPSITDAMSMAVSSPCSLASVSVDDVVTIDWPCVEQAAKAGSWSSTYAGIAVVMLAIRDHRAKSAEH